jgi:hypothetical protein
MFVERSVAMTAKVSVKACVTGVVVLCSTTLASAQVSHRHHYAHHVSHNPVRIHGGVVHDTMCGPEAYAGYVTASDSLQLGPRTVLKTGMPLSGAVVATGVAYDPYHLPDSYNYDWPYGLGLGH